MSSKRREIIRTALDAIRERSGGRLSRTLVVEAAKAKGHPLHDEFEWNDRKAAMAHRLAKAGELIAYVTVVVTHEPVTITSPYYVRDPNAPPKQQGHVALTSDELDREDATQIILNELSRCEGCIDRARGVSLMLDRKYPGISDELETALEQITNVRHRITPQPKRPKGGARPHVS